MSIKAKWEKSLQADINKCDDYLNKAKPIVDAVPAVEQRKKEDNAKLLFVQRMPSEFIEEYGNLLLPIQLEDEKRWNSYLPNLPDVPIDNIQFISQYSSTGGSASYYGIVEYALLQDYLKDDPDLLLIRSAFIELAYDRDRNNAIFNKLGKLNPDISNMFMVAKDNYAKSINDITGIDIPAKQFRDVIDKVWGELSDKARGKTNHGRLELKRETNRSFVANSLLQDPLQRMKLFSLLNNMFDLHQDLSRGEFMKNPLTKDIKLLDICYSKWILQLDNLVTLLDL